jgi:hypothetical protein
MRDIGRIFEAWTIALVSPASLHSFRNTELRTWRAAGLRPNDTLEMPRVKLTPGYRAAMSRIALIVSSASRRVSSCPVEIGKVRQSTRMSERARPQLPVRSSISRAATRAFHSAVRACPSSSMVSATTAAPCSRTMGITRRYRDPSPSPSSKLTELTTQRPPSWASPASMTAGSVESSMIGSVEAVAKRPASSRMSSVPSRPT